MCTPCRLRERDKYIEQGRKEAEEKWADALIWCSGSDDFQIEGKARKGWEKLCKPLLDSLK